MVPQEVLLLSLYLTVNNENVSFRLPSVPLRVCVHARPHACTCVCETHLSDAGPIQSIDRWIDGSIHQQTPRLRLDVTAGESVLALVQQWTLIKYTLDRLTYVCPPVRLCIRLSLCPSACLFVDRSVCLSLYLGMVTFKRIFVYNSPVHSPPKVIFT